MIGKLVKFKIPGLNGSRVVSGTVKRVLSDGRLEVKSQNDGYYFITVTDVLPC